MEKQIHNHATFRDVLSDYLWSYGIQVPENLHKKISDLIFDSSSDLEALCAVKCGGSVLLVDHHGEEGLGSLVVVNIPRKRVRQYAIND